MGQSTNGMLAYGYSIGDGSPPVVGLGEDEDWRPADFVVDRDSEEYYDFDFRAWAERKLLTVAGHPVGEDDYYDPDDLKKYWGVWFEAEGWSENPSYLLVTFEESSDTPRDVDLLALERQPLEEGWNDKLAAVLKVLDIEGLTYPEDLYEDVKREQRPRWMLTSYWS